jgi:histidinol-phosphatase (PHP family)
MRATYHNHSVFSDGKATIAELVAAAAAMGIDELGVSDHLTLHPSGVTPGWSMRTDDIPAYFQQLQLASAPSGSSTPTIRSGLEIDFFPTQIEAIRAVLRNLPLDYVIGSVHYVGEFVVDSSPEPWSRLTPDEREQVHREYWAHVRAMAQNRLFDIAAHLDLPKKFGYFARGDLNREIGAALDAIAEAGMVVELNTAGWHKPCADAYPSLDILRECRRRDIRATLSADAHQPEHLLRDFDRGLARLADAGYEWIARFAGREVVLEPLADASPT